MKTDAETAFVERVCLPFLRNAQNQDGSWGFHPASQSRVEPTSWALSALSRQSSLGIDAADNERVARGLLFLRTAQLANGSWPSTPGEKSGTWVTSLACCVLRAEAGSADAVAAGLNWLCDDWPRDSSPWRRLLARFSSQRKIFPINNSYRGWGWTPGTSSWVEPTAFALLALERAGGGVPGALVQRRRELATALLYDRMCPGGGWNCGNPSVYGVAGEALVVPTAFALLALRAERQRRENVESLDWLARAVPEVQSAGSLAVARICMTAYGREWPARAPKFADLHANGDFLNSVQVMAWTCLAIGGASGAESSGNGWLAPAAQVSTRGGVRT
jgi:Prenyltransferase and squalene oxidase repeat